MPASLSHTRAHTVLLSAMHEYVWRRSVGWFGNSKYSHLSTSRKNDAVCMACWLILRTGACGGSRPTPCTPPPHGFSTHVRLLFCFMRMMPCLSSSASQVNVGWSTPASSQMAPSDQLTRAPSCSDRPRHLLACLEDTRAVYLWQVCDGGAGEDECDNCGALGCVLSSVCYFFASLDASPRGALCWTTTRASRYRSCGSHFSS